MGIFERLIGSLLGKLPPTLLLMPDIDPARDFRTFVEARLPPNMHLPESYRITFDWLSAHNHVGRVETTGELYANLQPLDIEQTIMGFETAQPFMTHWLNNPDVEDSVFVIARTGGDGSHAALWDDGSGRLKPVHLGSGSGSTWAGLISDDPDDLLRLMAIGYDELCWPDHHHLTPEAAWLASTGYASMTEAEANGDYAPIPPVMLRSFLTTQLGMDVPDRASDIIPEPYTHMGDDLADPFTRWLETHRR